jgi:hypothetical protein
VVKNMLGRHGGVAIATAIAAAAICRPGNASSVLETVGAPGVGNGFTARTLSRGADVAYFNPALLPDVPSDLDFGLMVVRTWERISLARRPAGVDVPDAVYDVDLANPSTNRLLWPQPTSRLLRKRASTVADDVIPYAALGLRARSRAGSWCSGFTRFCRPTVSCTRIRSSPTSASNTSPTSFTTSFSATG